ncbi:nuclear transport factor 2 family protein [Euzebya sp.]|uniref:nuclear transport factor 2 family protein n=1 Tax=Euzebya sp. TaxID=1971409 RepID=UPI0035144940
MEAYAALMRRYCIDYTSVHDQAVTADLMRDDYQVIISGRTLGMDAYTEAVAAAFRRYPTLVLTVHDMILSGDRLAMRFSEHGAVAGDPSSVAVWPGISLYDWDGEKLRTCRVEQDFQGRDEQTGGGFTTPLEPGHPDPWATTTDGPADQATEAAVRGWLEELAAAPAGALHAPGGRRLETGEGPAVLDDLAVQVDDLFTAGDRAAAAITMRGVYAGGLPGVADDARGVEGRMHATLMARVADGAVVDLQLVRDRWGLIRRLRKALQTS